MKLLKWKVTIIRPMELYLGKTWKNYFYHFLYLILKFFFTKTLKLF